MTASSDILFRREFALRHKTGISSEELVYCGVGDWGDFSQLVSETIILFLFAREGPDLKSVTSGGNGNRETAGDGGEGIAGEGRAQAGRLTPSIRFLGRGSGTRCRGRSQDILRGHLPRSRGAGEQIG